MYLSIFILSVFIASVSQVLLKISADKKYKSLFREYFNLHVIGGYGMFFISTILTITGYRGLPLKAGPIVESLGYIFIIILSIIVFKEKIDRNKIIGTILIILGIIIFSI